MPESQKTVLQEAQEVVYGPRQAVYGHPRLNFERNAALLNGYVKAKYGVEDLFDAADIGYIMVILKMARLMETPAHRDSLVDMAGYTATIARVQEVDD